MSMTVSRDIASEFKCVLSRLPLSALQEMESSFTKGLNKKSQVTKADQAILQSFQDENDARKKVSHE